MQYRVIELSLLSVFIHYCRWQLEIYTGVQSPSCILSVDDSFSFSTELNSVTFIYHMVYCIHKHHVQEIKFIVLNCCKILMTVLTADTVGTLYASGSILDSLNLQSSYLGKYNPLLYGKRLALRIVIFTVMKAKSRSLFWYKGLLCPYKILYFEIIHSYTSSPAKIKIFNRKIRQYVRCISHSTGEKNWCGLKVF